MLKLKRKIKIDDKVKVISGEFKNKISTVLKFHKKNKVVLKNLNKKDVFVTRKKMEKDKVTLQKVKLKRESGIDISNVVLLDKNNKKIKIGYKKVLFEKNKNSFLKKIRINKKNGEKI